MRRLRRRRNLAGPMGVGCLVMVIVFILAALVWILVEARCIRYTAGDLNGGDLIETESRDYYALEYEDMGSAYILEDFYEVVEGKWKHRKAPLPLEKDVYQYIRITRDATIQK